MPRDSGSVCSREVRWRRFAKLKVKQIVAMKALSLLVLFCSTLAWAQPAPAGNADKSDTVVGILDDGTKITRGELDALTPLLSETYRPVAEQNPERFLTLFGLFKKAAALADQQKLADQEPFKQGVEFATMEAKARLFVLNAQQRHLDGRFRRKRSGHITASTEALPENQSERAQSELSDRQRPRLIPRPVNASRRWSGLVMTEDEAKAKAEKLVTQIRGGADFSKPRAVGIGRRLQPCVGRRPGSLGDDRQRAGCVTGLGVGA